MSHSPAYDPVDPRYFDRADLRSEMERVFKLCADCRLCNRYCGSFPKLFEAVDGYCTDEKYAEVDMKKLAAADADRVVELCFQCKLCYVKCPYTPGDHEWAIDFPRLMARARSIQVKERGLSLRDRVLGDPDLVGKLGSWTAPLANWVSESRAQRAVMERVLGIHRDKKLPPFAWKTFASRFRALAKKEAQPSARIAFYPTCYVNYNEPEIGVDTLEVMERNRVDVAFAYEGCCGMPAWHNGDMEGAIAAASENVKALLPHVSEGRTIVVTNPTCSQMIRVEYPRMLGNDEAKRVAASTMDPTEFLASLAARGALDRGFKTGAGKVNCHVPCHLRAQGIGYQTRDVLSLLPDTTVNLVEECSGHDGTWSLKKENFEDSMKRGGRAFAGMAAGEPDVTCSDCPLAAIQIEQGTGRKPLNPIQILARSYRGEAIEGNGKSP